MFKFCRRNVRCQEKYQYSTNNIHMAISLIMTLYMQSYKILELSNMILQRPYSKWLLLRFHSQHMDMVFPNLLHDIIITPIHQHKAKFPHLRKLHALLVFFLRFYLSNIHQFNLCIWNLFSHQLHSPPHSCKIIPSSIFWRVYNLKYLSRREQYLRLIRPST